MLDAALQAGVPVVYVSSTTVYGANDALPLSETAVPQLLSPYAVDKLSNELHAKALGAARNWPSFGLRFFNVYGPRQSPDSPYSGVVSIFLQKARDGEDLVIYGDGRQSRDFIPVQDIASFLTTAMANVQAAAPVVNVCTGRAVSIMDLAGMLIERCGGRVVHQPGRAGDIDRTVGSPVLAARLLGLSATIALRGGLDHLLSA